MIAEWFDWEIREKSKEMILQFDCPICKSKVVEKSWYEPIPMHYESLISASKKKPKCKSCNASFKLDELGERYELIIKPN